MYANFINCKLWGKLHAFRIILKICTFYETFIKFLGKFVFVYLTVLTCRISSLPARLFARDFSGQDARTSPKDPKIRAGRVLIRSTWWLMTTVARVRIAACRRERFRCSGGPVLGRDRHFRGPTLTVKLGAGETRRDSK